ncbi:hypothetical protein [Nonomuraea sp. NPDC003804]|uniref:hypothetical protein n=1 Tax=Nonomuraea sp. NPDC003804 TaxID=3154547 RepID=UPI0033BFA4FE
MRLLAVLALVATFLLAPAGTACACSCASLTPKEAVKDSVAVFTGTVQAVRRLPGSLSGPPPPFVVTFAVDQVYKGGRAATVEVATNADSAACGYDFAKGARYLVFASPVADDGGMFPTHPGTSLSSSLCSGNVKLEAGSSGPLRRGDEAGSPDAFGRSVTTELLAALGTPAPPVMSSPVAQAASPVAADEHASVPAAGSSPGGPPWGLIGGAVAATVLMVALAVGLARLLARRR